MKKGKCLSAAFTVAHHFFEDVWNGLFERRNVIFMELLAPDANKKCT